MVLPALISHELLYQSLCRVYSHSNQADYNSRTNEVFCLIHVLAVTGGVQEPFANMPELEQARKKVLKRVNTGSSAHCSELSPGSDVVLWQLTRRRRPKQQQQHQTAG